MTDLLTDKVFNELLANAARTCISRDGKLAMYIANGYYCPLNKDVDVCQYQDKTINRTYMGRHYVGCSYGKKNN